MKCTFVLNMGNSNKITAFQKLIVDTCRDINDMRNDDTIIESFIPKNIEEIIAKSLEGIKGKFNLQYISRKINTMLPENSFVVLDKKDKNFNATVPHRNWSVTIEPEFFDALKVNFPEFKIECIMEMAESDKELDECDTKPPKCDTKSKKHDEKLKPKEHSTKSWEQYAEPKPIKHSPRPEEHKTKTNERTFRLQYRAKKKDFKALMEDANKKLSYVNDADERNEIISNAIKNINENYTLQYTEKGIRPLLPANSIWIFDKVEDEMSRFIPHSKYEVEIDDDFFEALKKISDPMTS